MLWPILALLAGILVLIFSADKFVDGAAYTANRFGMPPLLIGILILGFGSSMPEMVVSSISASHGNPGLALGNALGSNITNIALIVGVTALVCPIAVKSSVLRTEFPYLIVITGITIYLLSDLVLTMVEGLILIAVFGVLSAWSIYEGMKYPADILAGEVETELSEDISSLKASLYLIFGLIFLVIGSRLLVWGGVEIAESLGISDLIIGLTIVAVGTSLPELAASITAVRKGEHDLAVGNIIGSNLFNSTIVIGIAGTIAPSNLDPSLLTRDLPVVALLTIALFLMGSPIRNRAARINRYEGATLLSAYIAYNFYLIYTNI